MTEKKKSSFKIDLSPPNQYRRLSAALFSKTERVELVLEDGRIFSVLPMQIGWDDEDSANSVYYMKGVAFSEGGDKTIFEATFDIETGVGEIVMDWDR